MTNKYFDELYRKLGQIAIRNTIVIKYFNDQFQFNYYI